MRKVTFRKRDKEEEIYMDEGQLKVNWNGKEVPTEKIEGDPLHLRGASHMRKGPYEASVLGKKK